MMPTIGLIALIILAVPVALIVLMVRVSDLRRDLRKTTQRLATLEEAFAQQPSSARSKPSSSVSASDIEEGTSDAKPVEPTAAKLPPTEPVSVTPAPAELTPEAPVSQAATETVAPNVQALPTPYKPTKKTASLHKATPETPAASATKPAASPLLDIDGGILWLKRYFTEGNVIVRVGVLVLFVGVAFLLKYASDNSMLPIEFRVAGAALAGMAILITGWRLRQKRQDYALVLQGAGIGVLYLTAFAALKLYHLLPPVFVFACLVCMVVLSAMLAILQNARALAVLAIGGGFLAPILTSSGSGNHIALFSYYALLNAGILAIAWFKSWRILNVIGFAATFLIAGAWGVQRYDTAQYVSAQSFLILFFLFYIGISLLFARQQPPKLKGYIDGTLVFGLPAIAFSLQAGIVHHIHFGLAISSCIVGLFYLSLARWLWLKGGESLRLLAESFLALGIVFASLTIPFALDGEWIATAWSLEGAALLWISIRQQRRLGIVFATALQAFSGIAYLGNTSYYTEQLPMLNSIFMGTACIALAGLFSSWYLQRHRASIPNIFTKLSLPFLIWSLLWWFMGGAIDIESTLIRAHHITWLLCFFSLSTLALLYLEHRLSWHTLRYSGLGLFIVMAFLVPKNIGTLSHFFSHAGAFGWTIAFVTLYAFLFYRDKQSLKTPALFFTPWLHVATLWLLVGILSYEMAWNVAQLFTLKDAWFFAALVALPLLGVHVILRSKRWPVSIHKHTYTVFGLAPMILAIILWVFASNILSTGTALPLPYIPFLNPIDIMHGLVLLTLFMWAHALKENHFLTFSASTTYSVLAILSFVWLNGVLLRSLHQWGVMPFNVDGIMSSVVAQASISIFWTLLGLSVMVVSAKKHWRSAWICAAILLGATVAKLFFIDLGDREGLITILSFIVVGILLLVVGYVSPLPPKKAAEQTSEQAPKQENSANAPPETN